MNSIYIIVACCSYHDFTDIDWEAPICSVVSNNGITAKQTLSKVKKLWANWRAEIKQLEKRISQQPKFSDDAYSVWIKNYDKARNDCWNSFTHDMYNEDIQILRRIDKGNPPDEFKIVKLPVCRFKQS